eukprot:1040901-Rhodomonas_salina.1
MTVSQRTAGGGDCGGNVGDVAEASHYGSLEWPGPIGGAAGGGGRSSGGGNGGGGNSSYGGNGGGGNSSYGA